MKTLILIFFGALSLSASDLDYSDYARLLESYVSPEGVRYEAWAANPADIKALNDFLDQAAVIEVGDLGREAQMAFYINLYNAAMLQAVFEHYPLDSVKDIGLLPFSVFKDKFIRQGRAMLSLDDVEKGILLKQYFDPRIHFAVNCASESCPPLLSEPFVAARLEQQLQAQTVAFARSARAAQVDTKKKTVAYSELFKWYDDDFEGEHPALFLNQFREEPLSTKYKVAWIRYDWSLNSVRN